MNSTNNIKFGTDGWRGIIADDFTFANVHTASSAICAYILKEEDAHKGICIGYDTRFGSAAFARAVAEAASSAGIRVFLSDRITPTPALSYAVRAHQAAGGVMITSSHNPFQWNGVKYKASYGGSGSPHIMGRIECYLGTSLPRSSAKASVEEVDFVTPYVAAISKFADLELIAKSGIKLVVDSMYGAGSGIIAGILKPIGVDCHEIRGEHNPLFPGINPEPIEPHIRALQDAVVDLKCGAGMATDGDADRIGAVDERGAFVDAHKIYSVLLHWILSRKGWSGDITRAFNTTGMLDRIAAKYGRKLYEHGIGFKYVCELMLEKDILMGGEESGGIGIKRHLPERDGLLNALLLANVMAEEHKTLGELVSDLQQEFGEHQYGRIDLHIDNAQKESAIRRARAGVSSFAGMPVQSVENLDGIKFFLDDQSIADHPSAAKTWLLFRASGTEPLLRIYSEGGSLASVRTLLDAGRKFALEA